MNISIVIPVHKEKPNKYEKITLLRIYKFFKKFQIVFISPQGFDLKWYILCEKPNNITKEEFPDYYFNDIAGYNKLLCSNTFYKRFGAFDYILIAQLDSYVFGDQLEKWCKLDYDYIGAPWFDLTVQKRFYESLKYSKYPIIREIKKSVDFIEGKSMDVGNGGFSLRKVKSFIKYSRWLKVIEPNIHKYGVNEDLIWSILVPKYFMSFKIAPFKDALKFSFDSNAQKAFELNNSELPFGCHGWSKKENISFWCPSFINEV